ncbi:DNA repair ATPase [Thermosipho africanus H17ap60334]|jgi:DNA repair protein RecN (Recombination protein N)|uniref:DNA repair protein RecN n=1 Tax=Thermosipho africanus (strain TCF52B) TaxID=484019 RepID=B7IDX8_THEAB|nr:MULTISPECIES: AAA family ATPase [Thermosipho]ACJ76205.1 ATPase involved in DNA repair [Thermosipho africanus TCF52B]EKF49340.1 DNA repair ATPase [Thermosipho africanus H17ap60334]MBZ4649546.1 ATPase involved in repair [Thermosipho sp. (in: thermotogales)]MDK2838774.1 repair protein RecN [Thermosipho sp. (in: thermotogales)]MDK2900614.1 repair protein RecN [Thermosipho sp. (in: thermotogales)]
MKSVEVVSVHLHDYLYFKDVDIYFDKGLNVITGETGAGKSLMLDIFGILLGVTPGRVDNYSVEVVIDIPDDILEYEIYKGENVFSVKRNNSRTTFKINGRVYPKNIVSSILSNYITLHRQNSHMKFLEQNFLISILDEISNNKNLLNEYRKYYELYKELNELIKSESLNKLYEKLEYLESVIKEIEEVNPTVEEEELLNEQYNVATKLQETVEKYNEILNESEVISEKLWNIKKIINDKYEESVNAALDIVETLKLDIQKELSEIEGYDVKEIEEKIWQYNQLKRKYGPTLEDVLLNYENYMKELNEIKKKIELLEDSQKKIEDCLKNMKELSEKISLNRKKAAEKVSEAFLKHCNDLNLNIEIQFNFSKIDYNYNGFDKVELLGRTVKNQPLKPLKVIASGGELSRLMLALELSVVSDGILIFDEVDAGISGETGNKLAEKLKEVSERYQVIVVTHLPQVAVRADKHFVVLKDQKSGLIKELDEEERSIEIKRMVGSDDVLKFID